MFLGLGMHAKTPVLEMRILLLRKSAFADFVGKFCVIA
jgi:hypothetical protein